MGFMLCDKPCRHDLTSACEVLMSCCNLCIAVLGENAPARQYMCAAADSSVQYLQPYYHALDNWDPPPDEKEEQKAGRKRKARLPFVWLLIYRHLSGSGYHPRPFDHGVAENLNLFLFSEKPYAHQTEFRPAQASNRSRNPLLNV